MGELKDIAQGTMIGFTANKSETDAKKDTATNRMVICKTKQLYMNGERVGLTDAEATYITNKMKADNQATADNKFTIKLTASPAMYEKNGVNNVSGSKGVNVTFTATLTYNGSNVQASNVYGATLLRSIEAELSTNLATKVTLTWDSSSKTYIGTAKSPAVGTYVVKASTDAKLEGILTSKKSASVAVSAVDYIYYGVSTNDKTANFGITGFVDGENGSINKGKNGTDVLFKCAGALKTSAAGTYKFDIPQNGYAYILIPQGVAKGKFASAGGDGNYHASEGVSDVPFVKLDNLVTSLLTSSITTTNPITPLVSKGITFEVFRLASAQNAGTHNFTI